MAATQSLIGLFGATLVLARVGFALGSGRRSVVFAVLAAAISLVPVEGLTIAGHLRGVIGDLSMTTLVLLGAAVFVPIDRRERLALSTTILAAAVFLYPMALGLGPFDPYRLGFAPRTLLLALLVVAVFAWLRQSYLLLVCLLIAVAAHGLRLLESENLWDYLLDPWVAVASIFTLWPGHSSSPPDESSPGLSSPSRHQTSVDSVNSP